jgi:hypothetical protein
MAYQSFMAIKYDLPVWLAIQAAIPPALYWRLHH